MSLTADRTQKIERTGRMGLWEELRPTSFDAWLCLGGDYRDTAELQERGPGSKDYEGAYQEFCIRIHGYDPYEKPTPEPIVALIPYEEEIDRLVREIKSAQDAVSASDPAIQIYEEDLPTGWSEHKDDEGNIYFHHREEDIISYEHPLNLCETQ